MNRNTTIRPSLLLTQVALASLSLLPMSSHALGLGRLNVQSALGETLRAEIEVTSITPEEADGLRVRVALPDVFRAQGLDFNSVLTSTQVQLVRRPDGRSVLRIVSDRAVLEPFVDLVLDVRWTSGRLNRSFTMLFDPPANVNTARPAEPISAPIVAAAPSSASAPAAPAAVARPAAAAAAPRPRSVAAPVAAGDAVVVRAGDTLSRIADRNRAQGVSLDQMLVALYRQNPDAFINGNMNLIKAGARLRVPGQGEISALSADEARRLVRAHSSNFDAVRQGMASVAPQLPKLPETSAQGTVKAQVTETKPAATGDRLTLSKPSLPSASGPTAVAAPAPAPATEAALARNVEDLKKLAEAAKAASAAGAAPGPSAEMASAPVLALPASVPASAVAVAASVPASLPQVSPPAPAPASSGSDWTDLVFSPVGAAAGLGLLGLGGFLAWRAGKRGLGKKTQETLFGESRLQPDSFFGVTGGQRVDTRDGASGASSMSYSLSQLDAHGDVDPVAEADVYLAYGRDLQAEEILKEALRTQPERLAIRLKLLEVYAKRRDVRGFEQLATQLFAETRGQGDDWLKAQEMGRGIDAENPLYQAGGAPRKMFDDDQGRPEPMNATTMPQATPLLPHEQDEPDQGPPSLIDLDLDLGSPAPAPSPVARTQGMRALPSLEPTPSSLEMDLDLSGSMPLDETPTTRNAIEFELSDLGDLGSNTVSGHLDTVRSEHLGPRSEPMDLQDSPNTKVGGDSLMDAMQELGPDDADPMMRQLELAEEFRQIGDVEGARDVLQELVSQVGSGPLYERAKAMLDELR